MAWGELSGLSEAQRVEAMRRFEVLRPHLEDGVSVSGAARAAGVPLRSVQRWLSDYRARGVVGLARPTRRDRGIRHLPGDAVALIEGLALRRPSPSKTSVHRQYLDVARAQGWPEVSYGTVRNIIIGLDPALVVLAHQGEKAYREAFDLLHRHEADRPNQRWQADHTQLDVLLAGGERPWLTVILDDHSRAVTGYSLALGAPTALHTSLALRHAIWPKGDPGWGIHGLPDVLYVDHGSDFISEHLRTVAADLHIQLIYSTVAQPRGRGKIERFFRTVNDQLLATLPGHLAPGGPVGEPVLSFAELDDHLRRFLVVDYNHRVHSQTGQAPHERWTAGGFLPRLPDSLEDLDLLLATVAKARVVHRDGIRFAGHRYLDPTLAGFIGEPVTIRYDPRDLAEIRVFHHNTFITRAVCPDLAGQTITLKDITSARNQRRRDLRSQLHDRQHVVDRYLAAHQPPAAPQPPVDPDPGAARLKRYHND